MGVKTRNKNNVVDSPVQKKTEERKKCVKIEQYAPPEIKKLMPLEKLSEE